LVAVSASGNTADTIKYSTDVGQTWDSYKFTTEQFVVTGVLTEPGNRAMSVAVWGYTLPERSWKVHTFNFTTLLNRQCELFTSYNVILYAAKLIVFRTFSDVFTIYWVACALALELYNVCCKLTV
jgi:hypothetical protein